MHHAFLTLSLLGAAAATAATLPGFTYMAPSGQNVKWKTLPIKVCLTKSLPAKIAAEVPEAMAV